MQLTTRVTSFHNNNDVMVDPSVSFTSPGDATMKRPSLSLLTRCLLILSGCLLTFAPAVSGQGFSVFEQGTCVMARGGATVAETCGDGSAIFFNPAGLAGSTGLMISGGGTLVMAQGSFTADRNEEETELENDPIPVPHVYASYGVSDNLAAGLGMYVPYGLGTTWPKDFEGAFLGYDNSLQAIYVQPTLAYQVGERLSFGAGLTAVFGSVTITQLVDLSAQEVPGPGVPEGTRFGQLGIPFHTAFADARMQGSGTGIGGNFGVQFEATDWLRLGARFMTDVPIEYEGEATFEQVETGVILPPENPLGFPAGTPLDTVLARSGIFQPDSALSEQSLRTEFTMPAQFVIGTSINASEALTLFFDYQWTNWSVLDTISLAFEHQDEPQVRYENFDDTHGFRLGAEYDVSRDLSLRAGFITHTAAAPEETVTPLLPEAHRNQITLGLGWQPLEVLGVDVAYQYINQNDRRGRVREAPEGEDPTAELNSGLYRFSAHLIGATFTLEL